MPISNFPYSTVFACLYALFSFFWISFSLSPMSLFLFPILSQSSHHFLCSVSISNFPTPLSLPVSSSYSFYSKSLFLFLLCLYFSFPFFPKVVITNIKLNQHSNTLLRAPPLCLKSRCFCGRVWLRPIWSWADLVWGRLGLHQGLPVVLLQLVMALITAI